MSLERLTANMCIMGWWRGGDVVDPWIDEAKAYWFDADNPRTSFYFADESFKPEGVGWFPCHGWQAILKMTERLPALGCKAVLVNPRSKTDGIVLLDEFIEAVRSSLRTQGGPYDLCQ